MWVARDKNGELLLFLLHKPIRNERLTKWICKQGEYLITALLDKNDFPDLKWEDEPIEVELVPRSSMDVQVCHCNNCLDTFNYTKEDIKTVVKCPYCGTEIEID